MRKASVVLLTLSYFVLVNGRIARLLHGVRLSASMSCLE